MSQVSWTEKQKEVIDIRNRSLLVSAAAGSGKTAVLVERIISMVTDKEDPVDIDQLLVVTYTNAAAAEMRERVGSAIEKALSDNPEDIHLQRQSSLVHNAQITTIDSFCLGIVRNNFYRIGLEPNFRIADEGELKLIREEAADRALETFYAAGDPLFLRFVNGYSSAKSDKNIRDMMLRLYDYSRSYPKPDEWLDSCLENYDLGDGGIDEKAWGRELLSFIRSMVTDQYELHQKRIEVCREDDGPGMYEGTILDDLRQLEAIIKCETLMEMSEAFSALKFKTIASARGFKGSIAKQQSVKDGRDAMKKAVTKLKKDCFSIDPGRQSDYIAQTGTMAGILIQLVKEFGREFSSLKLKKNIADFSDLEHFALDILIDKNTGEYTDAAGIYRSRFKEVMIDEYQDSNYLQEELLKAVSGIREGRENMFMVGDVKQSIYRFRLARPELFMSKYASFAPGGERTCRIDLDKNFRSRPEVIDTVNDIFYRILDKDIGNIEYNDEVSLKAARAADTGGGNYSTEVLLVNADGGDKKYVEGAAIARRVKTLVEDQEIPGIRYRDIAVLLRTMSGWTEEFQKAFDDLGVPLIVTSGKGYFSAPEVQTLLSLLRIIDNPRQDIPLAAVMKSKIGRFSSSELAAIKCRGKDRRFFECVLYDGIFTDRQADVSAQGGGPGTADEAGEALPYSCAGLSEELYQKLKDFRDLLDELRAMAEYTRVSALLEYIYLKTGIYAYVSALPAGERRRANLDMLLEKAAAFEKTGKRGIFHFIRYIDKLIKYDVDYGEAEVTGEGQDAVRLTSIHKSKGLEYPVVVCAGMGKKFNEQDAAGSMVMSSKNGVALKWAEPDLRVKSDTLIRRAFSLEEKKENLGEEMRVLYVALTRARDKLILCGCAKPPKAASADRLTFSERFDAKCFYDWVLPALAGCGGKYRLEIIDKNVSDEYRRKGYIKTAVSRADIQRQLDNPDRDLCLEIKKEMEGRYPYEGTQIKKQKLSVSEIKRRAMSEVTYGGEEDSHSLFEEEVPIPYIPAFAREDGEKSGVLYGTAMHRVLQCLDIKGLCGISGREDTMAFLDRALKEMTDSGLVQKEDMKLVNKRSLIKFLMSDEARRMAAAAEAGSLYKEKPFVMTMPAAEFEENINAGGNVIIQGIIDVFWEENDRIVLLDYKTDRVKTPKELTDRYETQLKLYSTALERSFSREKAVETFIYSFCLDKAIRVTQTS